jgi:hypothetical protein
VCVLGCVYEHTSNHKKKIDDDNESLVCSEKAKWLELAVVAVLT